MGICEIFKKRQRLPRWCRCLRKAFCSRFTTLHALYKLQMRRFVFRMPRVLHQAPWSTCEGQSHQALCGKRNASTPYALPWRQRAFVASL